MRSVIKRNPFVLGAWFLAGIALLPGVFPLAAMDAPPVLMHNSTFAFGPASASPASIASDGTNFLVACQSSNGAIFVAGLTWDAQVPAPLYDLGRTGGVPRVAFDGANYLVVWPDYGDFPTDIYGQFIGTN